MINTNSNYQSTPNILDQIIPKDKGKKKIVNKRSLGAKIDVSTIRKFKICCAVEGLTPSEKIRQFILDVVKNNYFEK